MHVKYQHILFAEAFTPLIIFASTFFISSGCSIGAALGFFSNAPAVSHAAASFLGVIGVLAVVDSPAESVSLGDVAGGGARPGLQMGPSGTGDVAPSAAPIEQPEEMKKVEAKMMSGVKASANKIC
jgi:hypothetical protein